MGVEKGRILIVDDEEVIRDSCAQALEREGNLVKGAENGTAGLELLKEFHPDLVLIDLKMPGESGMKILEEMEAQDPMVIKVVITGYATISSAVDAMKKGAYDFVPKPFTPEEIRLVVSRGLERRRLLLESEALRREQEKTRRNMISLVSHELRAPLAATVQYLEVILNGICGEVSPEVLELVGRCDTRLREMLDLIGRWLSLATFDPARMSARFQPVSLSQIAQESMDQLRGLAEEKHVSLSLDIQGDSLFIAGSRGSLLEIFSNLVSNAIKYNKEKGWAAVRLRERDNEILAEISDEGIGISEEHLPRVFDEFYRVDGRRNAPVKGAGLGLAIVKKLVDAHGGDIQIKSRLGEGTTFALRFPKGSSR